jgi:hypothetical protein
MMAVPKVEVKVELLKPDRSRHPPLLPSYFITMMTEEGHGGVWEETCHGRDQLDICLKFLQAGVALVGGHVELPEIPRN